MNILDKGGHQESMANMTGIDFQNLSTIEWVMWIIDTVTTNHMVASLDMYQI